MESITAPDGVRIAYERHGSGPALIFLHALPGSHEYWRASGYIDALAPSFTVVALDTRGFGASDAPADPAAYAEERVLGDVFAVVDAVGAQRFTVWGHSYGATIARQLAATTDRVERVVMAGTAFGTIFTPEQAAEAEAGLGPLVAAQRSPDPATALTEAGVPAEELAQALTYPAAPTLFTIQSLVHWRPFQPADLRCPALVVTGTRDARVLQALEGQREAIDATNGHVRLVVLPDLNHEQLVTERAVVLPAVLPFLGS